MKPDPAIFVQTGWVRLDENTMFKTIGLMLFGKAPLPAMVAMPRVSAKVTKFGNDGDIDEVGLVPVLDAEQLLQPHRALLIQVNELAGVSDAAFKMFYQPVIHTLLREINMKLTNIKLTGLSAGILLVCASFGVYAGESHMAEALKHAEAAAKSADGKAVDAVVKHAQAAKEHADVAKEHLDAGITSLNDAIDHGKMKHADLAKKSADEAVTHLKAAQ